MGEEHELRSIGTIYAAAAALLICLALGVAACGGGGGGGGGSGSSPKPQQQPVAVTGLAGNISENEAEVSARINPNGQPQTTYYFEYGTTNKYGSKTPPKPVSGKKDQTVTADLDDLDADTTYHYRVVAKTGSGTLVNGNDQTFSTPAEGEGVGGGGNGGGSNNDNGTTGKASTGGGTTGGTTGKSTGGYTTTPPPSTGGYTTTPPPSTGGYTTTPPPSTGGYTTTPPP